MNKRKKKNKIVYNNSRKLYSRLLNIYYNDYNDISEEGKEGMGKKCNPKNLLIKGQRFAEDKEKSKSHLEKRR